MKAEKLLCDLINTLRADPKADVKELAGQIVHEIVNHSDNQFETLLASVLFASGTPVFHLERADIAEAALALGTLPGVKVERWPQGFIAPNRAAGSKPIVIQLTLENSHERQQRLAGRPKEG